MRRTNGDGSVFKLSGNRRKPWAVRITIGFTDEGKQKYKYISYHESKTKAKAALREWLVNPTEIDKRNTFKTTFEEWIEKSELKQGTINNHNSAFGRLKVLHKRPIAEITLKELENAISGHVPTAQNSMRKTIRCVFKYAMKYGYTEKNPSIYLEVEKHTNKKKINIFTPEEVEELWRNVGQRPFDDMPLFLLYTGLRISELLNIKISEVDLENRTFNITDSKTKNGIRIVPIHDRIFPLIQKRYDENASYLFRNRLGGGQVNYTNFIKRYWYLEHTRHEARHTFVSEITKCVDDRIIIKLLVGHSKKDITDHYTHRTIEELHEAINKLEYV